jgi:hypothetical protein
MGIRGCTAFAYADLGIRSLRRMSKWVYAGVTALAYVDMGILVEDLVTLLIYSRRPTSTVVVVFG